MDEVDALLKLKKQLIREMEWSNRERISHPRWKEFSTHCSVNDNPYEEIRFVAQYKPAVSIVDGKGATKSPEEITLSLLWGTHRVFAIDKQGHTNNRKIDTGRPYDRQRIVTPVHIHFWTERGDYYAEPYPMDDISFESVFNAFSKEALVYLKGKLIHPLHRQQYALFQ